MTVYMDYTIRRLICRTSSLASAGGRLRRSPKAGAQSYGTQMAAAASAGGDAAGGGGGERNELASIHQARALSVNYGMSIPRRRALCQLLEREQQDGVAIMSVQEFFRDCKSAIRDPYKVVMGAERGGWYNLIAVHPERIRLGDLVLDIKDNDQYHCRASEGR